MAAGCLVDVADVTDAAIRAAKHLQIAAKLLQLQIAAKLIAVQILAAILVQRRSSSTGDFEAESKACAPGFVVCSPVAADAVSQHLVADVVAKVNSDDSTMTSTSGL